MTLFQKRVSDSSFDRARTVTYTRPTFGNRCSNMLSVTLPRKPVPPIRKIFRPLKISVGESLAVMIQVCLPLLLGEGRGEGLAAAFTPPTLLLLPYYVDRTKTGFLSV